MSFGNRQVRVDIRIQANLNVSAFMARQKVTGYVVDNISDHRAGDEPTLVVEADRFLWRVPIQLAVLPQGRLGQVGTLDVTWITCWRSGMTIGADLVDEKYRVKKYKVQYPIAAYTFPRDATIRDVHFDDEHMHVELTDGRIMSVLLHWIPTVYHASPEERAKFELNRSQTMMIWDPAKCAINDEIRITDYFGPAT